MFVLYKRTKEEFIAEGLDKTRENDIVAIKGDANGDGACFYAMGVYVRDFSELGDLDLKYQPLLSMSNKLPYSLISGTPDLSVYALKTAIPTKLSQLTDDVVAGKYLSLAGGTMDVDKSLGFRNYSAIEGGGGWKTNFIQFYDRNITTELAHIGAYGSNQILQYIYIGTDVYNGLNLQIGENRLNWGDDAILHSGNYSNYALPITGGNLSGNIIFNSERGINVKYSDNSEYNAFRLTGAGTLVIGYGTSLGKGSATQILGKQIWFKAAGDDDVTLMLSADHSASFKGNVTAPKFIGEASTVADGAVTLTKVSDGVKASLAKADASASLVYVNTELGKKATLVDGKIAPSDLPDFVLGQVIYGGIITYVQPDYMLISPSGYFTSKYGEEGFEMVDEMVKIYAQDSGSGQNDYRKFEGVYFIANVETASGFDNGRLPFHVGDWIISNGSSWEKVDNTDAVTSVAGLTGNVTVKSIADALQNAGYNFTINSFTNDEKAKLMGIEAGAQKNVQSDWNAGEGDAAILNKPWTLAGYGITDAYTKKQTDETFLPLAGGVLEAASTRVLTINRINGVNSLIYFRGLADGVTADFGCLGFNGIDSPIFYSAAGNTHNLLHSGNYSNYALPSSGGTINGNLNIGSAGNNNYYYLKFSRYNHALRINNNDAGGFIVFGDDTNGSFTPEKMLEIGNKGFRCSSDGGSTYSNIIHSGNYSDLLAGGTINGSLTATSFIGNLTGNADSTSRLKSVEVNTNQGDLNTILAGGGIAYNYYGPTHWINAPTGASYGSCVQFQPRHDHTQLSGQLLWDVNHNSSTDTTRSLWWRASDQNEFTNSKWHQIAFTDSNVASATKLATSRLIYGVDFDGNNDIDGNEKAISIEDVNAIANDANNWNSKYSLRMWANNNAMTFMVGSTLNERKGMIQVGHAALGFSQYLGTLLLNPLGGNVAVGGKSADAPLHVHGNIKADGNITVDGELGINRQSDHATAFFISNDAGTNGYRITATGGYGYIAFSTNNRVEVAEAMRITDSGNVAIGRTTADEKLHVQGNITASGDITALGSMYVGQNSGSQIYMNRNSWNRFIATKEGGIFGWRVNGVAADVMTLDANGNLCLGGTAASERLHTYGNARIEGDIVATGKIKSTSAHIGAYEEVSMTGNYAAIEPNKFYKWGIVEGNLSVKLDTAKSQDGVTNEYLFQFTAGNGISFDIDSSDYGYIKWGNYMPTQIIMNMTYQVSILDGYASIIEYSAS